MHYINNIMRLVELIDESGKNIYSHEHLAGFLDEAKQFIVEQIRSQNLKNAKYANFYNYDNTLTTFQITHNGGVKLELVRA